jgi:hypothetical protein
MALRSVRATLAEKRRSLPGDELIPCPIGSLTHAITIERSPGDVWPWLAQMGADRAGWYSYDRLDNGGRPSTNRILPEFQTIREGAVFPALPGATDGFILLEHDPPRSLVLGWRAPDGALLVTWSFALEADGPTRTRLLVRARGAPGYRFHHLPQWMIKRVVPVIHFVMQRRQLLGIARRAESWKNLIGLIQPTGGGHR